MRGVCASCGKQGVLRRVRVDVMNRYGDPLHVDTKLCGSCAAAMTDWLMVYGAMRDAEAIQTELGLPG